MFNKLIASESTGARRGLLNPWVVLVSVAAHVVVVGGMLWASTRGDAVAAEEPEINPEDVTYMDITEIDPPPEAEMPEVAEAEPPPEQPAPSPRQAQATPAPTPRTPRDAPAEVTEPDRSAGFQELQVPDSLRGIPAPRTGVEPVRAEDFGGRGEAGGVAGGQPPEETGRGGEGEGEGQAGGQEGGEGTGGGGDGTYVAAVVDKRAELLNRSDIARTLQRLYPPLLRDQGVSGQVVVQFVVTPQGRIDPSSVRIISASHDAFVGPTREVLGQFRFSAAEVNGNRVRMLTQIPVTWQVQR